MQQYRQSAPSSPSRTAPRCRAAHHWHSPPPAHRRTSPRDRCSTGRPADAGTGTGRHAGADTAPSRSGNPAPRPDAPFPSDPAWRSAATGRPEAAPSQRSPTGNRRPAGRVRQRSLAGRPRPSWQSGGRRTPAATARPGARPPACRPAPRPKSPRPRAPDCQKTTACPGRGRDIPHKSGFRCIAVRPHRSACGDGCARCATTTSGGAGGAADNGVPRRGSGIPCAANTRRQTPLARPACGTSQAPTVRSATKSPPQAPPWTAAPPAPPHPRAAVPAR